jgi:hypothetical protein
MQKIDLDSLSIDELARLREQAADKLAEKVAARQRELTAELDKLSVYGKKTKTVAGKKESVKETAKESAKEPAKQQVARAA